jgi:hypothetical protein
MSIRTLNWFKPVAYAINLRIAVRRPVKTINGFSSLSLQVLLES